VQRKDGKPVKMEKHIGFVQEMREMWALMCRREVLWLCVALPRSSSSLVPRLTSSRSDRLPISLYAQWTSPYINSFLSLYFTVRARYACPLPGRLRRALLDVAVSH